MDSGKRRQLRIACIQLNAGSDWRKNLSSIRTQILVALKSRPALIALPETFFWRGPSRQLFHVASRVTPVVVKEFQTLAAKHGVAFLLGSVIERTRHKNKFYNTSILISERGKIIARYRKIHLFDVALGKVKTRESENIMPGRKIVTATVQGVRVGLTVCYDLRFPELFRRLSKRGAEIIFVPSNFTYETGKVHWEILLRARAIENLAFVVAPAQTGIHPSTGIRSFGKSLIIDPWGKILARGSKTRPQVLKASLDLRSQKKLRTVFPVLTHRRFL